MGEGGGTGAARGNRGSGGGMAKAASLQRCSFFAKKGAKLFLRVFDREKSREKEAFCSFLRFNYAMRIPPKSRCKCFPDSLLPVLQHGFRCNIFPLLSPLASVAASQASAKSRVNIGGRPFLLRGGKSKDEGMRATLERYHGKPASKGWGG